MTNMEPVITGMIEFISQIPAPASAMLTVCEEKALNTSTAYEPRTATSEKENEGVKVINR